MHIAKVVRMEKADLLGSVQTNNAPKLGPVSIYVQMACQNLRSETACRPENLTG